MRAFGLSRRRVIGLGAGGVAVLVTAATTAVVVHHDDSRAVSSASAAHPTSPPTSRPNSRPGFGKLSSHRLLVVGASYTQGLGATPETDGYAYLVGRALGWPTTVAGVAGTGFVNPGPHEEGTFAQRIQRLPRSPAPGLVLVQCGRNDIGYPPDQVRSAIVQTLAGINARFPQARVVFLGSIPGGAPVGPGIHGIDSLIRDAAARASVPFIDPVREQWITRTDVGRYTGEVAQHPNNAGYAFIARRVVADLIALSDGQITVTT